jgi:hypothetical protein
VNVKPGRRACCNRAQSARRTAKWRFGPSKKRHFAPLFRRFSPCFSSELAPDGALGANATPQCASVELAEAEVDCVTAPLSIASRAATTHLTTWFGRGRSSASLGRDHGRESVVQTGRRSSSLGRDHGRESVVQTGRRSSSLGRKPDLGRSPPEPCPKTAIDCNRLQSASVQPLQPAMSARRLRQPPWPRFNFYERSIATPTRRGAGHQR